MIRTSAFAALACALGTAFAAEARTAPEESLRPEARPDGVEVVTLASMGDIDTPEITGIAMERAMRLVREERWSDAFAAAEAAGPVAHDIVAWHALRKGRGDWAMARDFVSRNADWPGMPWLRKRAERMMDDTATISEVLVFFAGGEPQTGTGALRLAQAIEAGGDAEGAREIVRAAWTTLQMYQREEQAILAAYGDAVADLHGARLDMLLWAEADGPARRMLPLVDTDTAAIARTRLAYQAGTGIAGARGALTEVQLQDPGLRHDYFDWLMSERRRDDARGVMIVQSTSAEGLGDPEAWGEERRVMARAAMRAGDAETAYQLAANHFMTSGSTRHADNEWLAGFIALTDLGRPERALEHFETFETLVDGPISLGRAGYWQGRAHEVLGQPDLAQADFARAGVHQTAFYGQLAAERAGLPMDPALAADLTPAPMPRRLAEDDVLVATDLLLRAGERRLAARFLAHLAETQTPEGMAQLGEWAAERGEPYLQVIVAKRAAAYGVVLPEHYFPVHRMIEADLPVDDELALAIARRESEFHPGVASHVGAQGLMQLMPATAQEVAQGLGLAYSKAKLTADPGYNALLGSTYLEELEGRFGLNRPMVAAGYNAGPSRPIRWSGEFGDPRTMDADGVVDWIEHIQFRETRNYVQRVMESLPVYRARLSGETAEWTAEAELSAR